MWPLNMLLQFEANYRLFQFACHLNFLRVSCLNFKDQNLIAQLHWYAGIW